jgi:hypothetical protein
MGRHCVLSNRTLATVELIWFFGLWPSAPQAASGDLADSWFGAKADKQTTQAGSSCGIYVLVLWNPVTGGNCARSDAVAMMSDCTG